MTIRSITVAAIGAALLMGIVLPVATAQAPPCFTFDGQIKTIQCPVSFRPTPVQYYSGIQSDLYQQATDEGDELPSGFFDQQTINTLRQNAAQNQSQNASTAGTNQTTLPTNVTSTDIEPVRNGLNTARQSLEHNDTQAVLESINRAEGGLFAIMLNESKGPIRNQLTKLSDNIDTTRESVFNLDNEKALQDLKAADSQLLVISEALPTTTPTATEEEESEPQTFPFGYPEEEQEMIREDNSNQNQSNSSNFGQAQTEEQNQNQTNITAEADTLTIPFVAAPSPQLRSEAQPESQSPMVPPLPTPEPEPQAQQQEANITIPLNKTQQELVTIEELGGLNKTTHREITTTEVPLK